jgi:hypothetical protein
MFRLCRLTRSRTLVEILFAALTIFLTTIGLACAEAPPAAIEPAAFAARPRFPEPLIATAPTTRAEDQDLAGALAR